MCTIKSITIGDKIINVADIKSKYMQNIAEAAESCTYIDKIVLFGSSLRESCREDSDIDIAVFGSQSKAKALTSKAYRRFLTQIYSFDDFNQTYDILYFKTGEKQTSSIMTDINKGEVIYAK